LALAWVQVAVQNPVLDGVAQQPVQRHAGGPHDPGRQRRDSRLPGHRRGRRIPGARSGAAPRRHRNPQREQCGGDRSHCLVVRELGCRCAGQHVLQDKNLILNPQQPHDRWAQKEQRLGLSA